MFYGAAAAKLDWDSPIPVVAPHDDNSTPVGRVYQTFAAISGFCDSQADVLPHGTWPAPLPTWASLSIDHIWLSRKLLLVDSGIGPEMGTLHRPVWTAFRWQP
jgi:endonuclease/exonuclease/phosphatase (EEP) superfamily protein YafD